MKLSIRYADRIVGGFIILALIILVFVIFMLGKNQRWFARDYEYITYLNSATGVSENMDVNYKGFTIGRVKEIKLDETDRVMVTFAIFDTYNDRVREGSLIDIQVSPIGLGSQFIFYPGTGAEQIPEGSVIFSVNSKEGKRLIASGDAILPDREDSINNIVGQVNTLLSLLSDAIIGTEQSSFGRTFMNIEGATRGIVDLTGSFPDNFGESLNEILVRLDTILTQINQVAIRISDPENSIMSILDSQGPVYQDLTSTLGSVTASMRNLERTTDFVPAQLPQLTVILTDLHSTLKKAEDVLVALTNNPLLKGGVPVRTESSPGGASPRDLDF